VDDEWWPEDEEDGAPVRPSGPARPRAAPADYRPVPRADSDADADDREERAREIARREDGDYEQQIEQIYAPTPMDGQTAVAGVPVPLPPRSTPPRQTPPPPASAAPAQGQAPQREVPQRQASQRQAPQPPEQSGPPQYEQVQPGQQVSPEWRHERETPSDLPQAPESAWAQPPTAPLPIIKPRSAPANAGPTAKTTAPRAPVGVPHQVPAAPMPRVADDLARRRAERRPETPAERGLQGAVRRSTFGLISPAPGRRELELNADLAAIERRFGGLRQVTVVNPAVGAGKSVAVTLLALTFGRRRDGSVLAWDTGEAPDAPEIQRLDGFDALASAGSTVDFAAARDELGAAYELLVVGTGNDIQSPDWQAAVDATDQLVVTVFGRHESAESAARLVDLLERSGRVRMVRSAVTIVSLPHSLREFDAGGIERHFAARTRAVVRIPYDRALEDRPIDYRQVADITRLAWIRAAAAVADGL